jgi:hypothetical protein
MTQEIKLHGGPCQGKTVVVQDGVRKYYVRTPVGQNMEMLEGPNSTPELAIRYRQGSYSHVRHTVNDFEWDGWEV